ncbi:hypothetical protein [Mycoplasmopsis synoviae]|uniref:Putative phase-variable hemagglutinin n=1 Tax=Mycoplasmopsis synoviae (strain 53) TaxID=262723 RepID=Q4A6H6_MYCS5|nr:hypothetical protein [Mycoplasmopsis synoviae]AAZ43645.1 putative phase-variable hemagglutinin [Mycoplasmopsis synoviae 53]
MPKIVVNDYKIVADGYVANTDEVKKEADKTTNQEKLQNWFNDPANWEKLAEQLTKKLGKEKFKNMTLSNPRITWDEVEFSNKLYLTPKVTFNLAAKNGYALAEEQDASAKEISLVVRVLYNRDDESTIQLPTQGAYYTAAPSDANADNPASAIKNVNVYLNYTGPAIMLNADLPKVGNQANTTINGTSSVDSDFNTQFRTLVFNNNNNVTSLMNAVVNYVNRFDPKYRAMFVTNATDGVTWAKVQIQKVKGQKDREELRPGNLEDLLYNNKVFLQQVQDDSNAVYFAVNGVTSKGWLNTFLIRIPLTKFVRPISVLEAPQQEETQEDGEEMQQGNEDGTQAGQTDETAGSGTPQASTPQTMPNSSQ